MTRLGIDIGGTSVKVALLRGAGIAATARSRRYRRPKLARLIGAVQEATARVLSEGESLDALGICVPGVWDEGEGVITACVNVPSLVGVQLEQLVVGPLAGRIGSLPIQVVSDAHAAAHDCWFQERMTGRLLAISLGAGVGACVLDDGTPLRVSGRSSGHFGQIDVTIHEGRRKPPISSDGGRGGLEAYIGAAALEQRYGRDFASRLGSMGPRDAPLAALARAIRIGHAIYRPQHVRLLGGTGLALAPSIAALMALVEPGLTMLARAGWTLAPGKTVFHAAAGAARLAGAKPT